MEEKEKERRRDEFLSSDNYQVFFYSYFVCIFFEEKNKKRKRKNLGEKEKNEDNLYPDIFQRGKNFLVKNFRLKNGDKKFLFPLFLLTPKKKMIPLKFSKYTLPERERNRERKK